MNLLTGVFADLETNNDVNDCRVWLCGYMSILDETLYTFLSLHEMMKQLISQEKICFFHNLSFDGNFIINYLMRNGYTWRDSKKINNLEFTTLITAENDFFSIKIKDFGNTLIILDSYKILRSSERQIAKDFKLNVSKGKIDYNKLRPAGYKPDKQEIDYFARDCIIMVKALKICFTSEITHATIARTAFEFYKKQIGGKTFKKWFPELPFNVDSFCRKSYKGGWVYCAPKQQNKIIRGGIIYDVNALYPFQMRNQILPYGEPIKYSGEYIYDPEYPIFIQKICCQFKLKKDKFPCLQLKNTGRFLSTQYLTTSKTAVDDAPITFTLNSVDLNLFLRQYNVYNLEYIEGYKFKGSSQMFTNYVDYWNTQKTQAKKDNNYNMYIISKLFLNGLGGRFGMNPKKQNKIPTYNRETDEIIYKLGAEKIESSVYVPVISFITAYARAHTITAAQKERKRFIYSDTDSLHLLGKKPSKNLNIDAYELGAWKHEDTFYKGKFMGAKTYIEYINSNLKPKRYHITDKFKGKKVLRKFPRFCCDIGKPVINIHVAGLGASTHKFVSIDNFNWGFEYPGKNKSKKVRGGTIIYESTHILRPR